MATGLVPLATGGDGAGSVRNPAAWCGVLGLKATVGRLPSPDRPGLAAPGVLTRTAADAAAWWRAVSDESVAFGGHGAPCTAVWSADLGFADPDPGQTALARATADRPAKAGVLRLEPAATPPRPLDPATAWLSLRSRPGPRSSAPGLTEAHRVRTENDRRPAALFSEADLLLTPTTADAPHGHDGPGDRYSTALTWAFSLSGHPASSIPAGVGSDGRPAGLQLVARPGPEALLPAVAREAERHALRAALSRSCSSPSP